MKWKFRALFAGLIILFAVSITFAANPTSVNDTVPYDIKAKELSNKIVNVNALKTQFKFYGVGAFDIFSDVDAPNGDFINYAAIPVTHPEKSRHGLIRLIVRSSILGLETLTPTPLGNLKFVVEVGFQTYGLNDSDFLAEAIQNNAWFGLYQLYGSLGPILAGQTFTNFLDLYAIPETLNISNNTGMAYILQPQLRATQTAGATTFAIAIENPETDFIYTNGIVSGVSPQIVPFGIKGDLDKIPDLTLSVNHSFGDLGHIFFAGVFRYLHVDTRSSLPPPEFGAIPPPLNLRGRATAIGYGLNGTLKLNFFCKDNIIVKVGYGKGMSRYQLNGGVHANVFHPKNHGRFRLDTEKIFGGFIGYQHWWTSKLRSTFVYGYNHITPRPNAPKQITLTDPIIPNFMKRTLHSGTVNLFYSILNNLFVGVECDYGWVRSYARNTGHLVRIEAGLRYIIA